MSYKIYLPDLRLKYNDDRSAFFTWTLPWSKDKEQTTKEQETEMSAEEDKKKEKAARKK